jgi:hypothetical protein
MLFFMFAVFAISTPYINMENTADAAASDIKFPA